MIGSCFPKISTNNTGTVDGGIEVAQEEEVVCCQDFLDKEFAINMSILFKTFSEQHRVQGVSCYSVFPFEQLHNRYLIISKLVKN